MSEGKALSKVDQSGSDRDFAALARDLVDALPGHLWSTDSGGRFTYINPSMREYFGVGSLTEESDWLWRVHPDDHDAAAAKWRHSLHTGEIFKGEHRLRGADGEYRWFRIEGRPSWDTYHRITAWHGQNVDMEDQKAELKARTLELSLLVDMVPSHLWRLTPDGTTTLVNKRMADFLGLDVSNVSSLESVMDTIFHPDDVEAVGVELTRCLASGDRFSMRYRLLRADGAYRWMSGRAEPLRDQDGNIVQWFGLCHDIEDQVQATAALRRSAEKLAQATQAANLSQLSASIAHEINQPLAAIAADSEACSRWLSADPPNVERGRRAAERISEDVGAVTDVIARIRALFQHKPQARTVEDINQLINEVLSLMSDEIAATTTRIDTELDPALPQVLVDHIQVQQILVNLIRNGIQAMDSTNPLRKLRIKTDRDGPNTVVISVEDSGSGFSDPDRVFEPFFTTKSAGMGMGLPICRSMVESHGGHLWVKNNETVGATVAFTLPIGLPAEQV
ncbi:MULTISPECIES: PAS domain-containing sensor histidine kinase [unclassified Rhizobium]|uniref:PAS domain-containing sensor histidine kinase n=1 Tax=unclassified Rhizobium TaxID=2613769 RepID=UPI00161829D5|nr:MULTISPECIES: PAS domain-containing sensor histidine kinase [unclassified Rhizobium]MBB3545117.1 hypothetical protein [Rhizobium sp. BK399]MCS3743876.1 hypothetical protein [Rhizobium sp. BK661]MCS4095970.1 hypothetical protein [Rhizobium sp. BK176]